jgi:hypothetical protein
MITPHARLRCACTVNHTDNMDGKRTQFRVWKQELVPWLPAQGILLAILAGIGLRFWAGSE